MQIPTEAPLTNHKLSTKRFQLAIASKRTNIFFQTNN